MNDLSRRAQMKGAKPSPNCQPSWNQTGRHLAFREDQPQLKQEVKVRVRIPIHGSMDPVEVKMSLEQVTLQSEVVRITILEFEPPR